MLDTCSANDLVRPRSSQADVESNDVETSTSMVNEVHHHDGEVKCHLVGMARRSRLHDLPILCIANT